MKKNCFLIFVSLWFLIASAYGNKHIDGLSFVHKRLVFEHGSRGISFSLKNLENYPYLIQASISIPNEAMRENKKANDDDIPFIITPPLYRLESQAEYSWQIKSSGNLNLLPQDRESVFFIVLKAIPPRGSKNTIKFKNTESNLTFTTVIYYKFYYRPELIKSVNVKSVKDKLSFSVVDNVLQVKNDSPIYLIFSELSVGDFKFGNKKPIEMVPPFGVQNYQLPQGNYRNSKVIWRLRNERMQSLPKETIKL